MRYSRSQAAFIPSHTPLIDCCAINCRAADNGKEFAYHQQVSEILNAKGFFAHPYHSWERGLNENTNGLIRQYSPKGREIGRLSDEGVKAIMDKLNDRPRKCLGFRTPNQVFNEAMSDVALAS